MLKITNFNVKIGYSYVLIGESTEKFLQQKVAENLQTKTPLNSCFIMCFKPERENIVNRRTFFVVVINESQKLY